MVALAYPESGRVPAGSKDYYFSVESKLRAINTNELVRRPGGIRQAVVYDTSSSTSQRICTEATNDRAPTWNGLEGSVVSGSDFWLFRLDGVLELDGRITIRASDGSLIDAAYHGLIDLFEEHEMAAIPCRVVAKVLKGELCEDDERARALLQAFGATVEEIVGKIRAANREGRAAAVKALDGEASATSLERNRLLAEFAEAPEDNGKWKDGMLDKIAAAIVTALSDRDGSRLLQAVEDAARAGLAKPLREAGETRATNEGTQRLSSTVIKKVVGDSAVTSALEGVREAIERAIDVHGGGRKVADALGRAITREYSAQEFSLYEDVVNGSLSTGKKSVEFAMPIVFEMASGPWSDAPGEDMSWIGSAYRVNEAKFWRYRPLVRRPFVARGRLSFAEAAVLGRPLAAEKIALRVHGAT